MTINATIQVPTSGSYFTGHFPGQPILPGVAELALTLDALAQARGQPVTLREIVSLRLRQLVLPGHRLELSAKPSGADRMRIELTRDAGMVANGEIVIGVPALAPDAAAAMAASVAADSIPDLDELLPQRRPMRFVTSVQCQTDDGLTCAASIPAACALVAGGSAPALAGLEAAAQTAALWEALRRWREGGAAAPRVGYLVAFRNVTLFAERIAAEQPFVAQVQLVAATPPLTHYRVEVSLEREPILRGTIATFLTEQIAGATP